MRSSANSSSRSMMAKEVPPNRSAAQPHSFISNILPVARPIRDRLTGGRIYPQLAAPSLLYKITQPSRSRPVRPLKSLVELLGSSVRRICLRDWRRQIWLRAVLPPHICAVLNSSLANCLGRLLGVGRLQRTSAVTPLADGRGGRLSHVEATPILPSLRRAYP